MTEATRFGCLGPGPEQSNRATNKTPGGSDLLRRSNEKWVRFKSALTGSGTIAAIASANLASEPGVASACSSSGSNYRFSIPVTEDLIRSQGGKPFYIHGISPVGRDNSLIDGSGALSIPAMQRNAAFVSQNMPAQLPTGRSVTGSVRFTNTGNVTWRQGQGYRAVLVGDTRGWSPGEVGLPSDVPPGGSVDFNFSLRAPLGAGGYNLRWRMRDGAGDFGNESSNQVVQVVAPPPVEHGVGLAARSYVYDANQQLCKVIEPESGSTVMAYDAAGNLAWSASGLDLPSTTSCDLEAAAASGRQVVRTYDTRNRLKTLRFPDKNGNQDWSYTPDGLPAQVTTWNDAGSSSVVNAYNYNKRRMLTSESSGQTGWYTWSIGYGYDANGALASQAYPTGLSINYAPNALGQPTDVRDQFGNVYASGIGYYPNGAARQFTYGNGVSHSLVLNGRQMPQQVRDNNVASFEYQYDANGNVGAIIDQQRGTGYNRYMGYDGLDRLMEAGSERFGGDNWNRYTYDVLDNILTAKLPGVRENNYWYDAKNRLTNVQNNAGATTVGLSYDPQGNLKNKNGQAYTFDYGNRLRDVTGKESYAYDAYGRRTIAGRPTTRTVQVYTQAGQLFYTEASGKGNMEYVYLNGSLLATRNSGTIKFQHTDALGSPIAVTDTAGQVVERTDYQPYGSPIGKTVDGIGYTGHAMDGATGLTYMQQRYYDQDLGRFLSVDPVAADSVFAANFNRYWYANNNPYKFTDPDGRQSAADRYYGAAVGYMLRNDPEKLRIWMAGEAAATTEGSQAEQGAAMGQAVGEFVDAGDFSNEAIAGALLKAAAAGVTRGRSGRPGDFTRGQRNAFKRENAQRNDGQMRCDDCGREVRNVASEKGVPTPPDQAQVHHDPPIKDGGGRHSDGKVVCPECHQDRHRREE
ncbi:RHS repeat domain-containing protein [Xanthomonas citri]|uniref:RHS repeat domain-containing protein n=2 Tax=Xanthomonas citri TaxID=346 RepID=UPI001F17AD23|nr:RHS repeat-associated core domain-containing protein [Xanthomonas citri]